MHTCRFTWFALSALVLVACSAQEMGGHSSSEDEIGEGQDGKDDDDGTVEAGTTEPPPADEEPQPSGDAGAPADAGAPVDAGPPAKTIACPTNGRISQGWSSVHDGIDLANVRGTPIYAAGPGEVTASGPAQGYGQWIRIKHDDGSMTEYGHMYQRDVAVGERVVAGQRIALMGSEGESSGPHLHLRTYKSASSIGPHKGMNPIDYMKARGMSLPCKP